MLQIKARYVPRCNTSAGWLLETIPLLEGEVGIETDTYKWKIGKIKVGGDNLLTPWDELKYMGSISEYTIGNLVSIDNNGNIVDSGTKVSDLEPADETILKKADVVNDLTSGGTDVPLSAEQGKALSQDVEILKTDNTTNKTDITLLQKEIKDTSKMIAEANPNGEPRATVSGINSVSLPKAATMGGGKVTIDGALVKNEVSYNPDTWEEWSEHGSVGEITRDASGITINFEGIDKGIRIPTALKKHHKISLLYSVVENVDVALISTSQSLSWQQITALTVGNNKSILISADTITDNRLYFYGNHASGARIKFKDIRVYELPTGSQIEADATNLTADELNAKYPFIQGTQAVTKTRVKSVGKNLFDKSLWENPITNSGVTVQYLKSEDCFLLNGTATITGSVAPKYINIPIKSRSIFSISIKYISGSITNSTLNSYGYFGANNEINKAINWRDTKLDNTDTSYESIICNYDYITRFWFYCAKDVVFNNYKVKIQLEQNRVATSDEPYTLNSVYLTPQELYSLPNGVKDTIDTNGEYVKNVSWWANKDGLSTQAGTPSPDSPVPIVSNLPANTYKVQDWRGDWYEFTLTEDLGGIGEVRDAVEFDKYSHNGYHWGRTGVKVFDGTETQWTLGGEVGGPSERFHFSGLLPNAIYNDINVSVTCSHLKTMLSNNAWGSTENGIMCIDTSGNIRIYRMSGITGITKAFELKTWLASQHTNGTPVIVVYQLETPTRTPLTFTLNNSSTAPECPMEYFTTFDNPKYVTDGFQKVTHNQATGTLITYPDGTVYIENALADGGLYDGGITVLNTDLPIKTIERIQKIIDGYIVDIDVSKAVVSLDKLSFTHPNLVNGDVIVFEYLYEYAGINGQATVEYLDNRFVIADTANGKFYKYKPVVTNGVITSWAVVEV